MFMQYNKVLGWRFLSKGTVSHFNHDCGNQVMTHHFTWFLPVLDDARAAKDNTILLKVELQQ